MRKSKYSMMCICRLLLSLLLFFSCGAYSAAGCNQLSGFTLSPSFTTVANNTEGLLSSDWDTVAMQVSCSGLAKGAFVSHAFSAEGSYSGRNVTFEGVSYPLYTTNLSDVFYFGQFVSTNGGRRPLGEAGFTVGGYAQSPGGTFQSLVTVKIRFYTSSKSMTPGIRSVNAFGLVKGLVQSGTLASYSGNVTVQAFSFQVTGPSCTLVVPGEVKLKSVNLGALHAPGDTVDSGSFALTVKCNVNSRAYEVGYSMLDVNNPTNISSTLALANLPRQGSGVSVQVMDGATPVTFGAASKRTLGTTPTGGGFIFKPMNIRYIRTAANVRPGLVKAGVTIILSYQ